jgi:hypothetical protein
MQGYPGASFVDSQGKQIGEAASRDSTVPVQLVPLGPGAPAHATLGFSETGMQDPATCGTPVSPTSLRIYAPDSTQAIDLPWTEPVCPNIGQLHIQPVAAGASDQ